MILSATSQLGLTGRLDRNVLDHLLSVNGHTDQTTTSTKNNILDFSFS